MNDLQICNENQALIDMQINACNTAVDFFETNLKKGQRDFITQMGQLSIKAKEIQLEEDRLRQQYAITEIQEENKYRLATIDLEKTEVKAKRDVILAQIKAVSDYEQTVLKNQRDTRLAEIQSNTKIQRDLIAAQKEVRLEELKTEQLRIKELSKCHQKEVESIQKAYQFCMEFFYPQIEKMNQQLSVLREQHTNNFENQEAHAIVSSQIDRLEDAKDSINKRVENIVSNLNKKLETEKINYQMSMIPFRR